MSIIDNNDQEIVKMPGLWSLIMKSAALGTLALCGMLASWGIWITSTVWHTSERVAVLEAQARHGQSMIQNVKVGKIDGPVVAVERRDYYTSTEVAAMLKLSERTVTTMCSNGELPATRPEGARDWHIAKDFIVSGKQPLASAASGKTATPDPDSKP